MIEAKATVIEVSDSYVWLEIEDRSTCVGCSISSSCESSMLPNIYRKNPIRVQYPSSYLSLHSGDKVAISIEDGMLLRGALLAYLLPLVFILFGLTLWRVVFNWLDEFAIGIIGISVGFLVVGKLSWRYIKSVKYQPLILIRIC